MRIGELARRTGVATSRIRFYERNGVLPQPIRGDNGYRDYPDSIVKLLRLIDDGQRLGFSLGEIRAVFSEESPYCPSRAAMIQALHDKSAALGLHIAEAQGRQRRIAKLLAEIGA